MILITGASGQVGNCFRAVDKGQFLLASSTDLDITDSKAVTKFFDQNPGIRWCVNCAAYTAVDKAESEPEKARKVNVQGPSNLARVCEKKGIPLIHLSSDYVYHSRQNVPFSETDAVSPKSIYARTKLGGDRAVIRLAPQFGMVIRTSWVYAREGHNFVKTIQRIGRERTEISVVFDQVGTPTYAPDLVDAILQIIEKSEKNAAIKAKIAGVWHFSNEGVCSWYDFAVAIVAMDGLGCRVRPIESAQFPTPAPRPPFSVLNKRKIKEAFGLEIPHWEDGLKRFFEG